MTGQLIIRADAGPLIGSGHVMRCLALAQAWQKGGGSVRFLSAPLPEGLRTRMASAGFDVMEQRQAPGSSQDATTLIELATTHRADWVVIDGYQFGAAYQEQIQASRTPLLLITDYGLGFDGSSNADTDTKHFHADMIVDQNLGTNESIYRFAAGKPILSLGPRYALLRPEFDDPSPRKIISEVRRILVTMGGADPSNATQKVLAALATLPRTTREITVVIGPSNSRRTELESFATAQGLPVQFVVDPPDMCRLMMEADLAVAAAGSTVWELCATGLPSIVIVVAANQQRNADELGLLGATWNAGEVELLSPAVLGQALATLANDEARRSEMSRRARSIVDGRGAFRVWRGMKEREFGFRPVTQSDCRQIWEWANLPEVRAVSFSPEPIPWATHQAWFQSRIDDPAKSRTHDPLDPVGGGESAHRAGEREMERAITPPHPGPHPQGDEGGSAGRFWMIVRPDDRAVGQVRFDPAPREFTAIISISLDPSARGQGWGSLVIRSACRKLFAETELRKVEAWIRKDNAASQRAFEKAEFKLVRAETIKGQAAVLYELDA